jgi:hypothetical protein
MEMKPCPFCGSAARVIGDFCYAIALCDTCVPDIKICSYSDGAISAETIVAEKWNRRADPPPDVIRRIEGEFVAKMRAKLTEPNGEIRGGGATVFGAMEAELGREG